jgi:hypothetical protein
MTNRISHLWPDDERANEDPFERQMAELMGEEPDAVRDGLRERVGELNMDGILEDIHAEDADGDGMSFLPYADWDPDRQAHEDIDERIDEAHAALMDIIAETETRMDEIVDAAHERLDQLALHQETRAETLWAELARRDNERWDKLLAEFEARWASPKA